MHNNIYVEWTISQERRRELLRDIGQNRLVRVEKRTRIRSEVVAFLEQIDE